MAMTGQATATEAEVEKGIRGKLVEDLKAVVADAEELLKATANQTGERITAARAKAEESLKAAKARLAEQEGAVMARTRAAAKAAGDYVRANPWKAVGIAAGAGFVLCLLATRWAVRYRGGGENDHQGGPGNTGRREGGAEALQIVSAAWSKAHPLNAQWSKRIWECPGKHLFGSFVSFKEGFLMEFSPRMKSFEYGKVSNPSP